MKRLKMFILVLVLIIYLCSSALLGLATVTMSSYCYNSNSVLIEDVTTVNARYADYTILLPGEIVSKGGGVGLGDIDSSFSHEIIYLNEGGISRIGASLETDSATYGWAKNLDEKQEDKPLSLAVGYKLEDGTITTSFRNNHAEIAEDLTTVGCNYSGSAVLEPDSIVYGGSGGIASVGNFSHVMKVTSGEWAMIKVEGEGNIEEFQWGMSATSHPDRSSMNATVAAETKTEDEWLTTEMSGEAIDYYLKHEFKIGPNSDLHSKISFLLTDLPTPS